MTFENANSQSSQDFLRFTPALQSTRYHSLDFWRGVACISVAIGHLCKFDKNAQPTPWPYLEDVFGWILRGNWIAVPMFFVISGYCIAASADLQIKRGDSWFTFFRKRALRIFPPYWIWIAVNALVAFCVASCVPSVAENALWKGWFNDKSSKISGIHILGNLTLTETWLGRILGYDFKWDNLYLCHSWTLCYEEQFYAVVGLLVLTLGRRYLIGTAAITSIVLARCSFFLTNYNSGFFFDGRWLLFAAGVAVFCAIQSKSPWSRWLARFYIAMGLAWSFRSPAALASLQNSVEAEYFFAFGFACLLVVLFRWDRRIHESRLLRPVRFCGEFCYSFYLVHLTVGVPINIFFESVGLYSNFYRVFLVLPVVLTSIAAVGYTFHILVERRFQSTSKNAVASLISDVNTTSATPAGQSPTSISGSTLKLGKTG